MRKIQKRYYVLIFVAVIALAAILRDMSTSSSFEIIKNSDEVVAEQVDNDSRININTAGVSELSKLYGIGEKTAIKIIEYRDKNGNFEVIQDILKVPGMGEQKFEAIKNDITT